MTEMRMLWMWTLDRLHRLHAHVRQDDPERGDGILIWVLMTALLAAAAIGIVAIIVAKAKSTAGSTRTQ